MQPQEEKLLMVRLSTLLPSPIVSLVVPDSYWLTMYSPAALEMEIHGIYPVSYTHLDVYKRQDLPVLSPLSRATV